jgi:hypothetical protein
VQISEKARTIVRRICLILCVVCCIAAVGTFGGARTAFRCDLLHGDESVLCCCGLGQGVASSSLGGGELEFV